MAKTEFVEKEAVEWEEIIPDGDIWKPTEKEDFLMGVITDIKPGTYGNDYFLQDGDGVTWKLPAHDRIMVCLQNIEVGALIQVIYKGEKPTKKGNALQLYKVLKGVV
jgi:hypothetical protein